MVFEKFQRVRAPLKEYLQVCKGMVVKLILFATGINFTNFHSPYGLLKMNPPMNLSLFQVDAFTSQRFGGNPAAVVPLKEWLTDETLQNIALENNLSETAFFIPKNGCFHLRWFTPVAEVILCGHATLATSHVLWTEMDYSEEAIVYQTKSGRLNVKKEGNYYTMDFPTDNILKSPTPRVVRNALDANILEVFKGREDYLVRLSSKEELAGLNPDFKKLAELKSRGVIVTAEGTEVDFVSRCFYPYYGIDEDPVTGSAHTTLAPFWAKRLGKNNLTAKQISNRGGFLKITYKGERTIISGQAVTYLKGEIII